MKRKNKDERIYKSEKVSTRFDLKKYRLTYGIKRSKIKV